MDNNSNVSNNKGNGRELFYIVITIAIFIVMAVGATFAFFTATASSGSADVGTRSATLSLEYISYGSAWARDDLIPADRVVSEYSVEFQNDTTNVTNDEKEKKILCKDDGGNSICSIYEFQVHNPALSPQTITINLITENNGFANLKAMIYEVDIDNAETYNNITSKGTAGNNGYGDPVFKANAEDTTEGAIQIKDGNNADLFGKTPIYVNRAGVKKTLLKYERTPDDTEDNLSPSIDRAVPTEYEGSIVLATHTVNNGGTPEKLVIPPESTKSYIIVLYVANLNSDQTEQDADKGFSGRVLVSTGEGNDDGVSGKISASGNATLQGDEGTTEPQTGP